MALKPKSPTEMLQPEEEEMTSPVEMLAGSRFTPQDYIDRSRAQQAAAIDRRGDFSRGLEAGVAGMAEAWHGSGALASALIGDEAGMAESAQKAQEYSDLAQQVAPEISDVGDVRSVGGAIDYAQGILGQMAPSLAAVLLPGGATGLVAKGLGQTILKKTAANIAKKGGSLTRRGAMAGAMGANVGIQSGGLAAEMFQPEFQSDMSPREKALLSLAGGTAAGAAGALPSVNILGRYGLGSQFKKALQTSIKGEAGKQALQEGTAEAAEQLVQRATLAVADQNRDVLGPDGFNELVNSFAAGFVGGGAIGGGARALSKTPGAIREGAARAAERARIRRDEQRPLKEIMAEQEAEQAAAQAAAPPPTEGIEVGEVDTTGAPDVEEIEITAPVEERTAKFMEGLDTDLESLMQSDINNDIFDEGPSLEDLQQMQAEQVAEEIGTRADLPPVRTALAEDVELPEGDIAPTGEAAQRDVTANIEFQKVTRDSRGQPVRELPFGQSTVDAQGRKIKDLPPEEQAGAGWQAMEKKLAKLNEGQEGEPYRAVSYAEVLKQQAEQLYPNDRQRRAEFLREKAAVVSQTRKVASARIKEGEDPVAYLEKFKVIEGPPTVTQEGATVGGRVPGDLALTEDDLSTAIGEIRGEDGFPITDGRKLGKERTRRQVLRPFNKDTVDQDFNKGKDVVLVPQSKGNPGKVLNAVSLTQLMQQRMPAPTEGKSMAQKVGEWFTAGVGSLVEAGHEIDINALPQDLVVSQVGRKKYTWGEAREAMGGTPDTETPTAIRKIEEVRDDLGRGAKEGALTEASAARINKSLGYTAAKEVQVAAGDKVADVQALLNKEVQRVRKEGTEYQYDPTEEDKPGIPTEDETKPMRPVRRDTPATGKRVAKGADIDTIVDPENLKFVEQAKRALVGMDPNATVPKLRATAIANGLTRATGQEVKPDQFIGKPVKEVRKELGRYKQTGTKVVQKTQTGYAREVTMETEQDVARRSTADPTRTAGLAEADANLKSAYIARKAVQKAAIKGNDGRLVPNKYVEQALRDAGLQFETKELFAVEDKKWVATKPKVVQSRILARLQQRIDAYKLTKAGIRDTASDSAVARAEMKRRERQLKMWTKEYGEERAIQMQLADDNERAAVSKKKEMLRKEVRGQPAYNEGTWEPMELAAKIDEKVEGYTKWYNKNKKQIEAFEGFMKNMSDRLGITKPTDIMSPERFRRILQNDEQFQTKVLRRSLYGTAVPTYHEQTTEDAYSIYLNPDLAASADMQFSVFAHEFGHVVKYEVYDLIALDENAPESKLKLVRSLRAAHKKWADEKGYDTSKYAEVIKSRVPMSNVGLLGAGKEQTLADLDPEYREYFMSFDEWFADQTARYLTTAPEANDIVGAFFKKIADVFRDLFNLAKREGYTADKSVSEFYRKLMGLESVKSDNVYNGTVFAAIKLANPTLNKQQVNEIARYARAAFRKENKAQHSDEEIARYAVALALDAQNEGSELNFTAMKSAYQNLLNTREREILQRAFSSQAMRNRVRQLLKQKGNDRAADQVMADPDALIAYGYQLWNTGQLQVGPKSDTMFKRLMKRLYKILGVIADSKNAEGIFAALRDNDVLVRSELGNTSLSFASPRQTATNMVQSATAGLRTLGQKTAPVFESLFSTAYTRMQNTKNLWLGKLAREFYTPPGTQGQQQGYFEAKNIKEAEYLNRAARILQGKTAEQKAEIANAMNSGKFSKNSEIRQAQEELKGVFEDMRAYAVEAGVALGDRSDAESGYFPWVFDAEMLTTNAAEFKKMLVDKMPDRFVEEYYERQHGQAVWKESKKPRPSAPKERIAERLYESILQSKGYADGGSVHDYDTTNATPYMGSHDTRVLAWLAEAPGYEKFLSQDLDKTLISYIDQTVRRSEFARRFGDKGEGIQEYLGRAQEAGMTPEQHKLARKYVQAMMGTLGGDLSPKARKIMSYVMVYENLRLLSMSLFSSLVDPLGIMVRTGSVSDSLVALRAGMKEISAWIKRQRGLPGGMQDVRLLAETVGSIEDSLGKEALGYEYGGAYMSGFARNINEKWFEVTGIAGYTRLTRVMATAAAQNFLKRHKSGKGKHSKRYLDELGVEPGDIRFDKEGNLRLLTDEERRSASPAVREADDRLRNAVFRFVDEAILRPNSAQRPVYGSDPHFMLVFHLKGFMYSFYETIMKRAWSEAAQHGNLVPLASMGLYVPGMIAADMFRDAVKDAFGDQDDDRKDDWNAWDWASHGLERSGLYGPYAQQLSDARDSYTEFGKLPGMNMFGPAAEHAYDIVTMRGGLDNQLVRALPGQNLTTPMMDSMFGDIE